MPKTPTKKPKTQEVNPRIIGPGDVVVIKGTDMIEAVRSVEVVLNLANGQAVVYSPGAEKVERVLEPEEGLVTLIANIPHDDADPTHIASVDVPE